jgi:ureidoacrylate peracid hydrolase
MHKIEISPVVLARAKTLRGSDYSFEQIDPARTAHLIVDLQNGFMAVGAIVETPSARAIVPNVNRICAAVREAGGLNVFIQYLLDDNAKTSWSTRYGMMTNPQAAKGMAENFSKGSHGFELWPGLDVQPQDMIVEKTRFGAFIPGSSNLHALLQARGIDTVIITGTTTNICCESTAREAMQLNYQVLFVTDGNAAHCDADHNATLNTMADLFADVVSTEYVVGLLQKCAICRW